MQDLEETAFQKEFNVRQKYSVQHILEAIAKHFFGSDGELVEPVSISDGGEELRRPTLNYVRSIVSDNPNGAPLMIIEDVHTRFRGMGKKMASTGFEYRDSSYVCTEKRIF